MNIISELFVSFLQIGLLSFGGGYAVIPLIQEYAVNTKGWLAIQEFTDIITISQMTPGPLAVNVSTFTGLRTGGLLGAAAATAGCVFAGIAVSLLLCRFFDRFKSSEYSRQILKGLKSASTGLILSAAMTLAVGAFSSGNANIPEDTAALKKISAMFFSPNLTAIFLFICAFILIRKMRLNPIFVMILCGISGAVVY